MPWAARHSSLVSPVSRPGSGSGRAVRRQGRQVRPRLHLGFGLACGARGPLRCGGPAAAAHAATVPHTGRPAPPGRPRRTPRMDDIPGTAGPGLPGGSRPARWTLEGRPRGGQVMLHPPVEPMLAQAAEVMPPVRPLASGVAYEQKFDGCRALVFTPAGPGGRVLLQSRRGALVQGAFPDLVAAAEAQLPHDLVLDGELLGGGPRSDDGTPPRRSSAPSPAPSPARSSSSSAATTRTAGCARSAAPYRCPRRRPTWSRSTWPPPTPDTPGRASRSPRPGGAATSWTCAWSAPTWWPRSAPTARSTGAASGATRSASSGCAWT